MNNEYWAWVAKKDREKEQRQKQMMRNEIQRQVPIEKNPFQIPTKGALNYLRYGTTKNVSKMSNDEKIKRLLNMYKNYRYSNERKQLSDMNKRIFGKSNFTANGILGYLQAMRPSIRLPQKLPPIPRRMPKNEINKMFVRLGGSLNNNYNRKKANAISKSKINWISFPKRQNPLFLAYAIKYNSKLNNINLAYFNKYGKINQNKKQKVLNVRNTLPLWNQKRHQRDPYKIAYVMMSAPNTGFPFQNRQKIKNLL